MAHVKGEHSLCGPKHAREINRMVTDALADYMFTTTHVADRNLLRTGAVLGNAQNSDIDALIEDKYAFERVLQGYFVSVT